LRDRIKEADCRLPRCRSTGKAPTAMPTATWSLPRRVPLRNSNIAVGTRRRPGPAAGADAHPGNQGAEAGLDLCGQQTATRRKCAWLSAVRTACPPWRSACSTSMGRGKALSNPYTGVVAIFSARLLNGKPPLVFEDGRQRRDFVHVSDVARLTSGPSNATAATVVRSMWAAGTP